MTDPRRRVLDPAALAAATAAAFGRNSPATARTPQKRAPVAAVPFARVCAAVGLPLTFVVPMPASPNRKGHGQSRDPRTIAREKRQYSAQLDGYACAATFAPAPWVVPGPPPVAIPRALVTVTDVVVGALNDEDNLAFRVKKWLGDYLVTRGYVATDMMHRPRDGAGLRWASLPAQRVSRKEPARITLTLTEITP